MGRLLAAAYALSTGALSSFRNGVFRLVSPSE
jgi:hypothetical protein